VVLLYEARVTNSLLDNFNLWIGLQCLQLGTAKFREDVQGLLPGPHISGLPSLYILKIV